MYHYFMTKESHKKIRIGHRRLIKGLGFFLCQWDAAEKFQRQNNVEFCISGNSSCALTA
jgi:hypothetical protein